MQCAVVCAWRVNTLRSRSVPLVFGVWTPRALAARAFVCNYTPVRTERVRCSRPGAGFDGLNAIYGLTNRTPLAADRKRIAARHTYTKAYAYANARTHTHAHTYRYHYQRSGDCENDAVQNID